MNRRNFFQIVAGVTVGLFIPKITKPKDLAVADLVKCRDELKNKQEHQKEVSVADYMETFGTSYDLSRAETYSNWKVYINGEEIDLGRAVNERGALVWPFQGAKKGDLCTAESPKIKI